MNTPPSHKRQPGKPQHLREMPWSMFYFLFFLFAPPSDLAAGSSFFSARTLPQGYLTMFVPRHSWRLLLFCCYCVAAAALVYLPHENISHQLMFERPGSPPPQILSRNSRARPVHPSQNSAQYPKTHQTFGDKLFPLILGVIVLYLLCNFITLTGAAPFRNRAWSNTDRDDSGNKAT